MWKRNNHFHRMKALTERVSVRDLLCKSQRSHLILKLNYGTFTYIFRHHNDINLLNTFEQSAKNVSIMVLIIIQNLTVFKFTKSSDPNFFFISEC